MGRTTKPIVLKKAQRESVIQKRKAFAKDGNIRAANRCWAILLADDGLELQEIVNTTEWPYKTVQKWLRDFRKDRMTSLEPKPKSGRPRLLTDHERLLLKKAIARGPRKCGYRSGVWTSPLVADFINKRWGVDYHPGHVRKLLHQLGFSIQFPREKLAHADKKKQERWMKKTLPSIKKKPV